MIPNLSYISEAAACVLDRQLRTFLVPYTDVVKLSSKAFHYDYWDRRAYYRRHKPLPQKVGSFQVFLQGFQGTRSILFVRIMKLTDGLKTRMFFSANIHGQISTTPASGQMLLLGDGHPGHRPAGRVALMMMTYLMESQVLLPKWKIQTTDGLCGPNSCNKASARSSKNL